MDKAKRLFEIQRERRINYILFLYEKSKASTIEGVKIRDIKNELNIEEVEFNKVHHFLLLESLIKPSHTEDNINITHQGIKAVEEFLSETKHTTISLLKNKFWVF
jgi:hypothetical protein